MLPAPDSEHGEPLIHIRRNYGEKKYSYTSPAIQCPPNMVRMMLHELSEQAGIRIRPRRSHQ